MIRGIVEQDASRGAHGQWVLPDIGVEGVTGADEEENVRVRRIVRGAVLPATLRRGAGQGLKVLDEVVEARARPLRGNQADLCHVP